jgi:hypothetical protein
VGAACGLKKKNKSSFKENRNYNFNFKIKSKISPVSRGVLCRADLPLACPSGPWRARCSCPLLCPAAAFVTQRREEDLGVLTLRAGCALIVMETAPFWQALKTRLRSARKASGVRRTMRSARAGGREVGERMYEQV